MKLLLEEVLKKMYRKWKIVKYATFVYVREVRVKTIVILGTLYQKAYFI